MAKNIRDNRGNNSIVPPIPLLIAAHCSTIKRKAKRLDIKELTAIFDDFVRELNSTSTPPKSHLNFLNEIVTVLNSTLPSALLGICSHYFFIIVRNTIRNYLQEIHVSKKLNDQDTFILRNCVLLIHYIVMQIDDVVKILHWITESTFLEALANCLNRINKISKKDFNQNLIKQIARLLGLFCIIQERLPLDFHQAFFVRLLQPTIDCLLSSNYVKLFQNLKSDAPSFTEKQKLYLIKCPYFLTTYNGPHIEKTIEKILEVMLPRYVSILDQHIKTIKHWTRPVMRGIHNLVITIVYAEGYFTPYTKSVSFRALIDHLLTILSDSTLISKIHPTSNNIETLLIDATLVVFSVLVYESDALEYIKQRKPIEIFRKLTKTPYETIVLNAYMMLAYTMDDNDIKKSHTDLIQLLSTTYTLLKKTIDTRQQIVSDQNPDKESIDRNILQLLETLKGLAQHEQVKNEILNEGILVFLIDCYKKLHGLSRQMLLECLWKLSFNDRIARQLREQKEFIQLLESIPKIDGDNVPINNNNIRRSNSYVAGRNNNMSLALAEAANYGIQKVADGLLWKIVKEPQFREKTNEKIRKQTQSNDQQKYKYNIMISYSYSDKDIVQNIHHLLANEGYKIWFDRDYNNGLAMETIAETIESSELILICMSDSYKRDNHCQAQAECALTSKRLILPLVVHSGYKPDGWLSSITHNNIYIDFGAYDFNVAFGALLREIKQRQHRNNNQGGRSMMQASAGVTRNPSSGSMSNFDRHHMPIESSAINKTTNNSMSSFPPVIINRQQQQQQQQGNVNSNSRSSTPGTVFTVSPGIIGNQQHQIASANHIQNSSSFGGTSSNYSNGVPQQREVLIYSASRSSTPSSSASSNPTVLDVKQQQLKPVQPNPGALTNTTVTRTAPTVSDKQQQQTSAQSVSRPPSNSGLPPAPVLAAQQQYQQQTNSVSRPPSNSGLPPAPSLVAQQQQQTNSISRTPSNSGAPSASSTAAVAAAIARESKRLPDQYTNRKTDNAIYRNISITGWRNNDVLDYLYDAHLYPMMPLCESMSGSALLRLFRMCQKKPSRLYDQLNEELRIRFNGLTLSMGSYTQFLTLMDSLVGPPVDEIPPQNVTERVIVVPRNYQQSGLLQPSPRSSVHSTPSSRQSKNVTPVEMLSEVSTPRGPRIVERAVYRPASNVGRPYNFIVESVEEPTTLLTQVQRYGNQLIILDETARHHRETSTAR